VPIRTTCPPASREVRGKGLPERPAPTMASTDRAQATVPLGAMAIFSAVPAVEREIEFNAWIASPTRSER
jgi:hypothetical protein